MRKLLFVLLLISSPMLHAQSLFDFKTNSDLNPWRIINDGVMGGLSQGALVLTEDGHGKFHGTVSLENYGGFTSVRCSLPQTPVTPNTVALLRIKGDGKSYQFRVKHQTSDYYTYVTTFATTGDWQTIELPLSEMIPQWRGRRVDLPAFDRTSITEMTLLIANKKNESFELLVDEISIGERE